MKSNELFEQIHAGIIKDSIEARISGQEGARNDVSAMQGGDGNIQFDLQGLVG